ncbi:cytochrome c-type biogenesis protein CcmH [Jiella sp. MQZ9-1]|uniref:Cytochrome c-type biogenesis protein n=2 Tax=Jiella flava TaxID=2816857 RepID=A0A939JT80_9HYPH|nr:cytochrome c-type biogenesis protein [Jiella flava]MBO0661850.1 cytochrome c-type biogenesis protein CcmH [Jiella flava]MCD2470490.1 cytochrome c-type biogenesis protein CcmH [Jiella flava]
MRLPRIALVLVTLVVIVAAAPKGVAIAPAYAVNPDEVLSNPKLEARARKISEGLRCLVCQNESIDNSNADLAKDLRLLVRKRLEAGDTDQEVVDYLVSRYGEFVLLKPRFDWDNLALWATPVVVLLGGGILAFLVMRRRKARRSPDALSAAEEAAIERIIAERG